MSKNILIFSDGTGQAGGVLFDEARSNVYKLFRATRCGPDSSVDPEIQLTFYDPGLGSALDGARIKFGPWRRIYNLLSSATGLGITRNIIDCYAAIVQLWEPGDRIYLFGFSRGAYTVRCVGGVLGLCGVPLQSKDGTALKRNAECARAVATEAVAVYQHGSSIKGDPKKPERLERARRFRETYGSGTEQSNTVPYFIGVWDTVAALGAGTGRLAILSVFAFAALTALVKAAMSFSGLANGASPWLTAAVIAAGALAALYLIASAYYRQWLSLARYRMAFYDTKLNPRVCFARHALSIDENRRDFNRVAWAEDGSEKIPLAPSGPERFVQLWFSGVHSDVGGSYPENESRLSDVALQWMVREAQSLPCPIVIDERVLRLSPSALGWQHDERLSTIAAMPRMVRRVLSTVLPPERLGWAEGIRKVPRNAPLHPSVMERLSSKSVMQYGTPSPYRPEALRFHQDCLQFFQPPIGVTSAPEGAQRVLAE